MNIIILIHLSSDLVTKAVADFLVTNGYGHFVERRRSSRIACVPHVLLVDVASVWDARLAQYRGTKVMLIDTGTEPERLFTTLLSHSVHGILSVGTEPGLFRKALTAVSAGEIWIDNRAVKALLDDTAAISGAGKIRRISDREKEIIGLVRLGLSNKEIARRLSLSDRTVRTHLQAIFRKLNITRRSKLMTLTGY